MRILALQLKRIGDLVLTTPALAALKKLPEANVTLAVDQSTASLLPAIPNIDAAIVFGRGRGWAPWQQVLTGKYDAVYDFTGTDRSAFAAAMSRAGSRTTFAWVKKKSLRALAYHRFIKSSVREQHTVDHYLDLVSPNASPLSPGLNLNLPQSASPYAILHPGTARLEKFWLTDRWADVANHLINFHNFRIILTTGPDEAERVHATAIQSAIVPIAPWTSPQAGNRNPQPSGARQTAEGGPQGEAGVPSQTAIIESPSDLCSFASLLAGAAVVVSVDTAAVHLAAAFHRPQVALFGPTNPFHWRPRHERAAVVSAAQPNEPMTEFTPRMKGAAMELIPSSTVIRAIDGILSGSA
jgi:ADP-heptose:LPS heptosyltransferase